MLVTDAYGHLFSYNSATIRAKKKPAPEGAGFMTRCLVDQFRAGVFSEKYSCESALSTALAGSLMARLAAPDWP